MNLDIAREDLKNDVAPESPSSPSRSLAKRLLWGVAGLVMLVSLGEVYYSVHMAFGRANALLSPTPAPKTNPAFDRSLAPAPGASARESAAKASPTAVEPPLRPAPFATGVQKRPANGLAPLRIVTRPGSNFFVKLVEYPGGREVMTAQIIGGNTIDMKAPLGSYELKYAAGETWYGAVHHFGPNTLYAKADRVFGFHKQGSMISGYTVELYLQQYGNLATKGIARSAF